jgi:hypothetical protein
MMYLFNIPLIYLLKFLPSICYYFIHLNYAPMKNITRLPGLLVLLMIILSDFTLLHAQPAPSIEWQKSFGGSDEDHPTAIQPTADGGFIVAGYTESYDGDVSANNGESDYWVIKLDASGNLTWEKNFGGSSYDSPWDIRQTADGGYVVTGGSSSNDGDVSGNHTGDYYYPYDFWVIRLDATGNLIWQKCLGGNYDDYGFSIRQTTDGGFITAGYSSSTDGDVIGNHSNSGRFLAGEAG